MVNIDLGEGLMPMVLGFGDNRAESEERNNDGLIHYQGELGDFWYDPMEFKVCQTTTVPSEIEGHERNEEHDYLCYVGKGNSVSLPKGCISTRHMFRGCELPEDFKLVDFDTSNVISMEAMFCDCILPEGFSLGDKFDTSNVKRMDDMFAECSLKGNIFVGAKFDTSNVVYMHGMFEGCELPECFSLGNKFDTSNVIDMSYMFFGTETP